MCFVVASVFDIVRIVRNAFQTAVAVTSFGALRRGILTCMVALVCGTCGHSSSTPSPTDVDVAGRVTDFPTGVWQRYTLWQFSSEILPQLRVPGTKADMDINVFNGSVEQLKAQWPLTKAAP